MSDLSVPIQILDHGIEAPAYAHEGDAGLDLRSTIDVVVEPHARALIPAGFALAIPNGYAGFVLPRSGLASKHGLTVANAPGLIDSGYRGEVKVAVVNLDASKAVAISRGDRIAQLVILQTPSVTLAPCESLDASERGAGGFGSTGH